MPLHSKLFCFQEIYILDHALLAHQRPRLIQNTLKTSVLTHIVPHAHFSLLPRLLYHRLILSSLCCHVFLIGSAKPPKRRRLSARGDAKRSSRRTEATSRPHHKLATSRQLHKVATLSQTYIVVLYFPSGTALFRFCALLFIFVFKSSLMKTISLDLLRQHYHFLLRTFSNYLLIVL